MSNNQSVKKRMPWLALVVIAVMFAGCGSQGETAETTTPPEEPTTAPSIEPAVVRVLFPFNSPSAFGYDIAEELGYYSEVGIETEFQFVSGGTEVIQQLLSGNGDVGVAPIATVAEAIDEGFTEIRAVFNNMWGPFCFPAAPEDSGIESIDDLIGLRIGVTDLAGGEVPVVESMFRNAGYTEGDYELVPVGEGAALAVRALDQGTIDAVAGCTVDLVAIQAQGLELTYIIPEEIASLPASGIYTTEAFLTENRDVLVEFLRATSQGYLFGHTNPEAALSLLKESNPEKYGDAIGEQEYFTFQEITQPPPGQQFGIQTVEQWQEVFEFRGGEIPDVDVLSDIVVTDVAEEANDFDRDEVIDQAENFES